MDDISIFMDKESRPDEKALAKALAKTYPLWVSIKDYVYSKYPKAKEEWNYPGKKYGWSFRIKDTKRAIIYLLPRDQYFKVAFVFGQKATDIVLESDIPGSIKSELKSAKVYAEGRGIRIKVTKDNIDDIRFLIDTKLDN
jgi:hypothetical protein